MSAAAALGFAVALAGCGTTTYFAGRALPPSGLANRVMIAIQNPGSLNAGSLQFVDAYYDIRYKYNSANVGPAFVISGFSGALPTTIQNLPEEEFGAVYSTGTGGSYSLVNYTSETAKSGSTGANLPASSIFITRSQAYIFAASQQDHVLTVVNRTTGGTYPLSLPGIYRVSVNPGGSIALAFVHNSNYVYYPRALTAGETTAASGGPSTWPFGAEDCEPQVTPTWCLFQALDPSSTPAHIVPLTFDRPMKAVFSADGSTAYVLNCGPECGGTTASVTPFPVAPMLFQLGQASGVLPTQSALNSSTLDTPGGASNALVDGSTMYVVGQQKMPDGYWGGYLTTVTLPTGSATAMTAPAPVSISDGTPGTASRMVLGDDNTLWIGMIQCTNGERANNGEPFGCLTMVNTSTKAVTVLPYIGDATGIAAVTGLHKVYTAEGGQVYIYSTVDGSSMDNQYVTVTGTAYDVTYMDATTDADNTVY